MDHTAQNAMPSIPQLMNLNYRKSPNPGTLAFSQPYRKPQSCTWKRQSPGISFPLRAVSRTPIDHSSTKEGSRQGAGRAKHSDASLQLSEERRGTDAAPPQQRRSNNKPSHTHNPYHTDIYTSIHTIAQKANHKRKTL